MKTAVELFDTTLRDGSQGEKINFSVEDKLNIARRLEAARRISPCSGDRAGSFAA